MDSKVKRVPWPNSLDVRRFAGRGRAEDFLPIDLVGPGQAIILPPVEQSHSCAFPIIKRVALESVNPLQQRVGSLASTTHKVMIVMSRFLSISFCGLVISAMISYTPEKREPEESPANLFEDSMTGDWREHWFLDGKKVTLEASEKGLYVQPGPVTKAQDPVEQTWDKTKNLDPRRPPVSQKGRIGLRNMGGVNTIYRNFQVRRF